MSAALPAIIMQRSAEPVTCMACGRQSIGLGVHEAKKPPGDTPRAWTCDNPDCIEATRVMVRKPLAGLNAYEVRALGEAAKVVADDALRACMEALYESGARDLDALTAEQVDLALERLIVNGALAELIKQALATFGRQLRNDVLNSNAPF
jgi:hypothetical protein